ncbi:MAG: YIP1 family protein [Candidatus Parvarchaeota archaeon]|nr:YIP1 family protein [Candidatus Jingweiarchaeum tengchongense]MCW1297728.1 YIP1 family protein [Candidatus Jingweiarchaeum tengchongense]MCW1299738.1 YIP1 family protein [Candidatus Jingweiarchaeum tengchongense]MCW1304291.1 YIP1 family protein [Candidatus Jingweiarchaeum tengchongense]MCW1305318.1 YIP1 family protein [Candidatus Jingweiarchaeum tengchongense]
MEFLNEIADVIKQVILNPMEFFEKHKTKDWTELIKITAVLTIIPAIATGIGLSALSSFIPTSTLGNLNKFIGSVGIITIPIIYILFLIINIAGIFIGAALLHIGVYLMGGREIMKTAMAQVYSSIPNYLLSWIPFVGFIVSIWSSILLIIGISKQHKLSYGKTILALIISTIITLVIVILPISLLILALGIVT